MTIEPGKFYKQSLGRDWLIDAENAARDKATEKFHSRATD